MKNVLLFIPLIIISNLIQAQNFQPGYVLLKQGDSLRGYINDLGWYKNPTSIEFKETQSGTLRKYEPGDLKEFGIDNGSYYVSRVQLIDKSEHRNEVIQRKQSSMPLSVTETVFLEVRVKGVISLYKLIDENEKVHYFTDTANKTEELILKKVYNNDTHTIFNIPLYQNQLSQLAEGCSNLAKAEIKFNDDPITEYVLKLNDCKNQKPAYLKRTEKTISEISFSLGASASKIDFNFAEGMAPLTPYEFSVSINPAALFTWNIIFPTLRKKWSVVVEAGYKGFKSKSNGVVLETHYGRINLAYRFTEPKKRKFFCQAGISNGLALKYSGDYYIENGFNKHDIGGFAGIGYGITKKAGFEIRFERSRGFSQYLALRTPGTAGFLFFNYKL